MNIQQERDDINNNNNTAQQRLINIIEPISKEVEEIVISEALYGILDFSILDTKGFKRINKIVLSGGKITEIRHLPKTLSIFICSNNLLISLDDLPPSLTELNCSYNHLTTIDFSQTPLLIKFNGSNNELTELKHLPSSLLELIVHDNQIVQLDLLELNNLKKLDSSNNSKIVLQNVPKSLIDLKMDNDPMSEIEHVARSKKDESKTEIEVKRNFEEALDEYYRLKTEYEKKAYQLKKKAFKNAPTTKLGMKAVQKIVPPCINCNRKVGSIFKFNEDKYTAVCGDLEEPCNLNIQLYRSTYYNFEDLLYEYIDDFENAKQSIIKHKMNMIFNYIDERTSLHLFKQGLEEYNTKSDIYKDLINQYNDLYNNMHKQELIKRKKERIHEIIDQIKLLLIEYEKDDNKEFLKTAMDVQKNNLIPELNNLRKLKYEIMEVVIKENDESILFQKDIPLSKIAYSWGELPRVVKFSRNY